MIRRLGWFALWACATAGLSGNSLVPAQFDLDGERVLYSDDRGYGFDLGTTPEARDRGEPFSFSVRVPEGNWRVTATFGHAELPGETTVKAESRRLMVDALVTAPGERSERSFVVNVRTPQLLAPPANAPGGDRVRLNERERGVLHWDDKLTLEFLGTPRVVSLRIAPAENVTTIFLAGDSTVTDQPYEPAASWGQMLTAMVEPDIAVANHAESGETLKSFLTGLRLDKLLGQVRPGDWVFIQFGHNDSKAQWPQTFVEAGTTYDAYLRVYLAEVRRRGAEPVLVTSVHRRAFDDTGRIKNTHGEYLTAVRNVAREERVPLVDLAEASARFYEALGPELAREAFNAGGNDATHHNNYGAYMLARSVVAQAAIVCPQLRTRVPVQFREFDPAAPPPPADFRLAASPRSSATLPRGN